MNPNVIRESLESKKGSRVLVQIFGMRNKNDKYIGVLQDIYPQIFTILSNGTLKSYSYSELINKEVVLSFI